MDNIKQDLEKQERKFTGIWIPKDIWEYEKVSWSAKLLWAEISALEGKDGCFASNQYFASLFNLSERRIQSSLKELKDHNLIYQKSFDGRKRYLMTSPQTRQKLRGTDVKNFTPEVSKTSPIDNRIENNTIKKENIKEKVGSDPLAARQSSLSESDPLADARPISFNRHLGSGATKKKKDRPAINKIQYRENIYFKPGEYEAFERIQPLIPFIDPAFELADVAAFDDRDVEPEFVIFKDAEVRTKIE